MERSLEPKLYDKAFLPEIKNSPEGENTTEYTVHVWPLSLLISCLRSRSQSRIVLSLEPRLDAKIRYQKLKDY